MPQSKLINRRVVLASRPHGAPLEANFRIEQSPIPWTCPYQTGHQLPVKLMLLPSA